MLFEMTSSIYLVVKKVKHVVWTHQNDSYYDGADSRFKLLKESIKGWIASGYENGYLPIDLELKILPALIERRDEKAKARLTWLNHLEPRQETPILEGFKDMEKDKRFKEKVILPENVKRIQKIDEKAPYIPDQIYESSLLERSLYLKALQLLEEEEFECLQKVRKTLNIGQLIITDENSPSWSEPSEPCVILSNETIENPFQVIEEFTYLAPTRKNEKRNHVLKMRLKGMMIKSIPPCIRKFKRLRELDMSDNQIDSIPEWLNGLPSLQLLDLGNNNIKILPEWLKEAPHLKSLNVEGNPLSQKEIRKWLEWQGIDAK